MPPWVYSNRKKMLFYIKVDKYIQYGAENKDLKYISSVEEFSWLLMALHLGLFT